MRAMAMCIEAEKPRGAARFLSKRELKHRAVRGPWHAAGMDVMTEAPKNISKTDEKSAEKKKGTGAPPFGTHQKPRIIRKPGDIPPAGPHATQSNTDPDATPGAGALPDEQPGNEVDPGTG
jgi:hypothetical protein